MAMPDKRTAEEELAIRRRKRSIALGLVLGGLVVLFYVLTIAKMGLQQTGVS